MGDPSNASSSPSPPSWSKTLAHYNPLNYNRAGSSSTTNSKKGGRITPPVFARDFAFANGSPVILAHRPMRVERASVCGSSARTFAEYVATIPLICAGPWRRR
jgi:hypothetical protein